MLGFWRVGHWWQIAICPRCSSSTGFGRRFIPFQWMCQRGSKSGKHLFTSQMSLFPSLLQQISPRSFQLSGQYTNQPDANLTEIQGIVESTIVTKRPRVVVSTILYFHPYLGRWSNLSNIFSDGLKSPTRQRFVGQLYFADKERTPKPLLKVHKPLNMEEYQLLVTERGRWWPLRKTALLSNAYIGGYMLRIGEGLLP